MINYIKSLLNSIFDFGSGNFEDTPYADALFNTCRHDFLKWSFGDNYASLSIPDKIDHWNLEHGEEFLITPRQNVHDTLKQMIRIYNRVQIEEITKPHSSNEISDEKNDKLTGCG